MNSDLLIRNYRCFGDSEPARIQLRNGFTAFVGPNNAGKSSLLKLFYELREVFKAFSRTGSQPQLMYQGKVASLAVPQSVLDREELFCNANERNAQLEFSFRSGDAEKHLSLRIELVRKAGTFHSAVRSAGNDLGPIQFQMANGLVSFQGASFGHYPEFLDTFQELSEMLYIGPFRNAINLGGNSDYFDMPIGESFISSWSQKKTGGTKSIQKAILDLTADIQRIFGFKQLEINASPENKTMQLVVDHKPYLLSELGSGLAHFIVVLATAAYERPSFILIDEPEMGLHPSLQLDFLTTLGKYASRGVIFATHSLGLARSAAERIYSVRRKEDGLSELRPLDATPRLSEFLRELSFSGYQELGFDKVLLVEGVTEVKTFQQLLRKYGLAHKVVLLPMGGGQLINANRESELQELKRISPNISAVIDSERDGEGQPLGRERQAFVETCAAMAIPCLVLQLRATENYLCSRAIKATMGETFSALAPFARLRDTSPSWSKSDNWRIASEMTRAELDVTDLGQFLSTL